MSLTKREFDLAYEAGKAARRGQKRITDCPFNGKTESVRLKGEAWCNGFRDQHDEYARQAARVRA